MAATHLILGGARSGKSRFAVQQAPARGQVVFVATALPGDADMARRIARHRAERPGAWRTVEAPHDLIGALRAVGPAEAVVVDCLTLWTANRLLRGDDEAAILAEAQAIATLAGDPPWPLLVVTNEVGEGVHPETAEGVRFRDLLGLVNQRLAAAAGRVTLMVAGLPLTVKDEIVKDERSRRDAVEAP